MWNVTYYVTKVKFFYSRMYNYKPIIDLREVKYNQKDI